MSSPPAFLRASCICCNSAILLHLQNTKGEAYSPLIASFISTQNRSGMRRTYISSIPDEIILEIFSYLVEPDAIDDDDLSDDDDEIWDWIVVTHICRRWRTLAVNDPRLWTAPDLATHSHGRLEAFIVRSRSFLLTVDNRKGCRSCMRRDMNPWGCEIWDDNLSIVLNHLSRIRSLLLDYCTLDRAMQLCDKAAPMLETLDIAFHGNDFELPFSLPVPFLAGGMPRLRKIRLNEGILSFNSTLLRDLTHLTINDFYDDDDHYARYSRLYPSVEEILLTLKACPSLKVLILGAVKDSGPDEILRIGEHFHVSLTCLRTLILEDMSFQAAEKLFSLMDVPNVSNFAFGIRFAYQDSRSSLLSILKRFTERFAYDTMELRFELFKTVVDCSIENEDVDVEGKLDLYHIDDDGKLIIPSASVLASILTEFIEKTTLRGVNSLTLMLNDKPVFNCLQWDDLLVLMPNIKELSIYRFSSSMSKAMIKTFKNILFLLLPNYHDVENLWDVLWLSLNSLKINFVPNPQVFEDVLAEVLERRYLLNRRLRFLEFSSCGTENTELINNVSPYVDTTEWVCDNGTRMRYTTWIQKASSMENEDLTKRLPNEVIAEIFVILRDWCTKFNNTKAKLPKKSEDWTVVTRVCMRWRNIAISYPRLWTTLDLSMHSEDRIQTFLARSKNFALKIDKRAPCRKSGKPGFPCEDCQDNILTVLENLPRIRAITVKNFESDDFSSFDEEDALVLEEINLSVNRGIEEFPMLVEHNRGGAPSLRRVKLEGCMFTDRVMRRIFKGLTLLSITDHYVHAERYQRCSTLYLSVVELQNVLKECPELTKLELGITRDFQRPFPELRDPLPGIGGPIYLQSLKTLKIGELDVNAAEKLFSSLKMPNLANIDVGIIYSRLAEAPRILSILNTLGKGQLPNGLLIEFDGWVTRFIAMPRKGSMTANPISSLRFSLLYLWETVEDVVPVGIPNPKTAMRTAIELFRGSSWTSLTTLRLYAGCKSPVVRELWVDFFKAAPNLSALIWESDSICNERESLLKLSICFLSALTPTEGDSEVVLPNLTKFSIRFPDITDLKKAISQLFRKRKASNHPVITMVFDQCDSKSGYWKWLKSLKKYVHEVSWIE